jgi:hypothetical protein
VKKQSIEQSEWEWEIQQAVMTIIARAANHEVLREHPERLPACNYCDIAQMIENMVRSVLEAPEPSLDPDRFDAATSTVRPEAPAASQQSDSTPAEAAKEPQP